VESGAYNITGVDADTLYGRLLNAEPGAYVITGFAATTTAGVGGDTPINAAAGAYVISGAVADLQLKQVSTAGFMFRPFLG